MNKRIAIGLLLIFLWVTMFTVTAPAIHDYYHCSMKNCYTCSFLLNSETITKSAYLPCEIRLVLPALLIYFYILSKTSFLLLKHTPVSWKVKLSD